MVESSGRAGSDECDTAKYRPPAPPGMTEDHEEHEHHDTAEDERSTAPQSDYTTRDVAVGAVVAAVGLLVTFAIPLLLA